MITGAAGGIGSVLVDRFVDNGDTVATDVSSDALDQLRGRAGAELITAAADGSGLLQARRRRA